MYDYNIDAFGLIFLAIAILFLFIALKKFNKIFSELALHYNGEIYRPYFNIGLGVEIPFRGGTVIFDPYGIKQLRKNERQNRPSLTWKMPKPTGIRALTVQPKSGGAKVAALIGVQFVQTNDAIFDQTFDVISRDAAAVLSFLSSEMREALLAKRETIYTLEIENSDVLILCHDGPLGKSDQFRHFIDEGIDLLERIV